MPQPRPSAAKKKKKRFSLIALASLSLTEDKLKKKKNKQKTPSTCYLRTFARVLASAWTTLPLIISLTHSTTSFRSLLEYHRFPALSSSVPLITIYHSVCNYLITKLSSFLAVLGSMWDLSFLTRNGTSAPPPPKWKCKCLNHWTTREVPALSFHVFIWLFLVAALGFFVAIFP